MVLPDTRPAPIHLTQQRGNGAVVGDGTDEGNLFSAVNEVEAAQAVDPNLLTTSKGVVIRVQGIPNMMLADARRKIKPPKIPTWHNPDKDRDEENPNDPEYIDALQEYNMRVGTMGVTAMLAFGTEVMGKLPADVQSASDPGWSDDLKEILDVDVPAGGKGRYAAWLRLYVLSDPDLTEVTRAVSRASGIVTEAEVEVEQDNFRPDEERDAAAGSISQPEG